VQALIFCFFSIKRKERALPAAAQLYRFSSVAGARQREGQQHSDCFKVPACAGMTTVLDPSLYNHKNTRNIKRIPDNLSVFVTWWLIQANKDLSTAFT
jgi:hypothetical protein